MCLGVRAATSAPSLVTRLAVYKSPSIPSLCLPHRIENEVRHSTTAGTHWVSIISTSLPHPTPPVSSWQFPVLKPRPCPGSAPSSLLLPLDVLLPGLQQGPLWCLTPAHDCTCVLCIPRICPTPTCCVISGVLPHMLPSTSVSKLPAGMSLFGFKT